MANTNWSVLIPVIVALVMAVPGTAALFLQMKRYQKEPQVLDSDASNKFMEAAKGEANYALILQGRINEFMSTMTDLKRDNEVVHAENEELKKSLSKVEGENLILKTTMAGMQTQMDLLVCQVQQLKDELSKYKGAQNDC